MKKYIVKFKDSEEVFREYISREEASAKLMEYIYYYNTGSKGDYISPFDFVLEEVECEEVNEIVTDFNTARNVLGIKSNADFTVMRKKHSESDIRLEDVARLVKEINPKHIEALIALNRLFTIAEAWNKADGFVPDFSDWDQAKYYPWFKYDKDAAGFVYVHTYYSATTASAYFGPRLCFMTSERADQFGKQFAELYNKVFI